MYDDKPLWEHAGNATGMPNSNDNEAKPTRSTYISGGHKTASSTSPIMRWYLHNDALRQSGKFNEIDLKDIQCAVNGTYNKWHKPYKANKETFDKFIANPGHDTWELIKPS